MTIELQDTNTGSDLPPVLKRRRIGETYTGALALAPLQRDQLDADGNPKLKTDNMGQPLKNADGTPKARQELVLTLLTQTSDMIAGLGGTENIPAAGDPVRVILRGKAYGEWIDADNALKPRQIGDLVTLTTDLAVRYDANGKPVGEDIVDQAEVDNIPRNQTVGMYGSLTLIRNANTSSVAAAEAYYTEANATPVATVTPAGTPAMADDIGF